MLGRSLAIAAAGGLLASGLAALPASASVVARAGSGPAPHQGTARQAMLQARARWLREHGTSQQRAVAAAALRGALERATGSANGMLTGVVRGIDGRPVAGACVSATGPSSTVFGRSRPNGRYILPGLRSGAYTIHIDDCAGSAAIGTAPRSYLWPQLPATVALGSGQAKNLPAVTAMPAGGIAAMARRSGASASQADKGAISGRVSGPGHGLSRMCVLVTPAGNGVGYLGVTNRFGRYRVGGIRPGRYRIVFTIAGGCGNRANWLDQWYPYINSPFQPAKAAVIRVRAGKTKSGIDAHMKLGGEISGAVRTRAGTPLRGICVEISGRVHGGFEGFTFRSGRGGRFDLPAVFPGKYTVGYSIGCGNKANYAPQWWRLRSSARRATVIKMTGTKIAQHIDAALDRGAAISGIVKAVNAAGKPLAGVCVDTGSNRGDSVGVFTGKDGRFRLAGLLGGRYVVEFDPSCSRSSSNFLRQNRTVSVARAGSRTGVNAYLQPGAGFSGVVTGPHGHPLAGVCVEAEGPHGAAFAESDFDGTYSVAGQHAGQYTVAFFGCDNPGSVAPQFYNDESNSGSADPVTLTAGHITTGIDATMHQGSTITGVVTDSAGHALSNVCVGVADQSEFLFGDFNDIEYTGSSGAYRSENLAPGLYQVNFGCASGGRYASHWYLAKPQSQSPDLLSIPVGVTSGINGVLRPGGAIAGRVTDMAGHPVRSACMYLVDARTGEQVLSSAFQGDVEQGRYKVTGLAPGRYKALFYGCGANLASQWYHGRSTLRGADPVRVRARHTTGGINATLGSGGSISGQVVDRATGKPVRRVCVDAENYASQAFGFAVTDKTGHYAMRGLASGRYVVTFSPCYAKGPNLAALTKVSRVTAPHATKGVNARLGSGATVSGRITDGSHPQAGTCVELFPLSHTGTAGFAQTGFDGTYTATGLAAGQYQVYFNDSFCLVFVSSLASQWYNGQPTEATADTVTVTPGGTTSGIDATLQPFGTISGTVTGPGQAPVVGECVTATPVGKDFAAFYPPEVAITTSTGSYTLGDVQPGTYKVKFSTGCGGVKFATQWWQNAPSADAATVITVGGGAAVAGIDATLKR